MEETRLKQNTEGLMATGARKKQEAPKWGKKKQFSALHPSLTLTLGVSLFLFGPWFYCMFNKANVLAEL